MIASSFDYTAPETLSDALKALADDPEAKVLAGRAELDPDHEAPSSRAVPSR